jgi:hypothetical protein
MSISLSKLAGFVLIVALDMKKLKHQRHRVDFHYDPVKLTLTGGDAASGAASEGTTQN